MLAGGAVSAEMLLVGAPWLSAIGKLLLAVKPHSSIGKQLPLRRSLYNSIGKTLLAEKPQGCIGKMLLAWAPLSRTLLAEKTHSSIGKY